jgi:D-apiose dehydrogenase
MGFNGAIVGCGFFARNHLAAWREVDGANIVAVCDTDLAKAKALGAAFGVTRCYADASLMAEAERLDFVDIITTVESHRLLVELFAAQGVAAICQKPFARDVAEAHAMVAACAQAGVPLMVHENFRWQSALMAVKSVVDSGEIGAPQVARISFRHAYDIYAGQPYLATEERLAIMDLGIHLLDLARYYLGEATRIACRTQRINARVRGEDSVSILLDHASGALSFVDFSFFTHLHPDPFPQTLVRIEGADGVASLDAGYRLTVEGRRGGRHKNVEPAVPKWGARPWHNIQDSVRAIQQHWIDCLRSGREPDTSGADNLKTLALVELAYESAAAGRALPTEMAA